MDSLIDVKRIAKRSSDFRRVIATGARSQLVLMTLAPGEEIGSEVHPETDQILFVLDGEGRAVVAGREGKVEENDVVFVPAGTEHNLVNSDDDEDLKIVTIYAPPEYEEGTVHPTKADAMAAEGLEKKVPATPGVGTTVS
jgi:mannose-6-phosphate isomerase-like protein (cupin superfamily)